MRFLPVGVVVVAFAVSRTSAHSETDPSTARSTIESDCSDPVTVPEPSIPSATTSTSVVDSHVSDPAAATTDTESCDSSTMSTSDLPATTSSLLIYDPAAGPSPTYVPADTSRITDSEEPRYTPRLTLATTDVLNQLTLLGGPSLTTVDSSQISILASDLAQYEQTVSPGPLIAGIVPETLVFPASSGASLAPGLSASLEAYIKAGETGALRADQLSALAALASGQPFSSRLMQYETARASFVSFELGQLRTMVEGELGVTLASVVSVSTSASASATAAGTSSSAAGAAPVGQTAGAEVPGTAAMVAGVVGMAML